MCDYSLEHVKSRPAKVGDKLTTRDFGRVTRGFAARRIRASQFASYPERNCHLQAR
jgi:hypothetical protein